MKKIYTLMCALLPLAAMADEVKVTTPSLSLKNDTLTLSFQMDVADVEVNSTQAYAFTPVLSKQWRLYALPPVVVSGKKKFKMRKADRKIARNGDYKTPYTVIYGKADDRQDVVDYTLQIPYQQWMSSGMDMIILEEGKEACVIDLPEIQLVVEKPVEEPKAKPQLPQAGQFCEPCVQMVSFIPYTERTAKTRSMQKTLYIEYPVGGTAFKADYKNNAQELKKMQDELTPLTQDPLVTFKAIRICGYASPDGSVKTNERMASTRAASFATQLKERNHLADSLMQVQSGGEDWEELKRLLNERKPAFAAKALEVIAQYDNLDVREAKLKTALGAQYSTLVKEYYPSLRRLGITVDYEIREVTPEEAAQFVKTRPEALNLREILSAAKLYKPGSPEYREIYEVAVNRYPDNAAANINAAAAQIIYGDFERAARYLSRVKDDPRAWNNLGVLAWLQGNTEVARVWFNKALQSEPAKAKTNLEIMEQY